MSVFVCAKCGAVHEAPPYNESFVLYDGDGKCWCVSCLCKKRTDKRTRKDRWSPEDADAKIVSLRASTAKYLQEVRAREELFEYFDLVYAPFYIPSSFYNKLNSIFDGALHGLSVPVPPEDLLDMFRKKQAWLDRNALKKWSTNQPAPMSRLNYDLSIILNSYGEYLQQKRAQEIENQQADKRLQEAAQAPQYVRAAKPVTISVKPTVGISSVLDDLFD